MAVTVPSTHEETFLKMFQVRHCRKERRTEPYVRDAVRGSGYNGGSYSRCQLRQSNNILHLEVKSKSILIGREEMEISHGRGIQSYQETRTRLQFFFPPEAKNTQGKNWRKVTKQEKNRKGGDRNFSLFRLLTVQWQKILLVTVLLYRIIKKKEPRLVYLKSKYMDTLCRLLPMVRKYTESIGNIPEGDLASRTHTALIITSIFSQCFMEFLLPVDRRRGEADDP